MDKRYDPKKFSKRAEPVSKKTIFSSDHSSIIKAQKTTTNTTSKLDTSPLDNAMQELLDICCKQYNDKVTATTNIDKNGDKMNSNFKDQQDSSLIRRHSINNEVDRLAKTTECDNENKKVNSNSTNMTLLNQQQTTDASKSVENLQQKQCEIQAQLDEVLQVSKKLASKQRKKLDCIFEDLDYSNKTSDSGNDEDGEEEDDELIEFQQIENELRISELNRQLNNIQEELRLRLFKRLLNNTNPVSKIDQERCSKTKFLHRVEETSPSSSSCSNEPSISTTTSSTLNQHGQLFDVVDGSDSRGLKSTTPKIDKPKPESRSSNIFTELPAESKELPELTKLKEFPLASNSSENNKSTPTNAQTDLDSAVDNIPDYEALTPTTSRESLGSSKRSPSLEPANVYNNICDNNITSASSNYAATINYINSPNGTSHPSSFRNNSANSDLERIEEDEEDSQDYYNNSDHFRSIYEEKISPIYNLEKSAANEMFANPRHSDSKAFNQRNQFSTVPTHGYSHGYRHHLNQEQQHITRSEKQQIDDIKSCKESDENSFKNNYGIVNMVNTSIPEDRYGSALSNRPLTLYLPKPDEDIDLVEHIQALGHDVDIISSDLSLNSASAQGYLWKSCSNNNKKWLRRYFYFDRTSKLLLYYDSRSQLIKKQNSPKNMIQFDEISDVYVDHKLSGIGEKDRSSKRKNYVFVLATIHRKYLLASSRAEVMRAWIDILFTAARANDYLQQLSDIGDEAHEKKFH